jgi:DNA-binding CsgD family transcriptional regulator
VIGRDRELARVESFVDASRTQAGRLLLEGDPGIGKTTLWRAGVDAAERAGYRPLVSRPAEAESSLSYAGLADLLSDVEDEPFAEVPEVQRRALEVALLRRAPEGRPPEPRAVFTAFGNVVAALAQATALLLAVDDLHWLDAPSLGALAFAGRRLRQLPVALLASTRPEAMSAYRDSFAPEERLRLEPLTAGALHSLVKERLGWSMPRPTLLRLHRACDGNAFYALELAQRLIEAGRPAARDEWPVPDDVHDLVAVHVRALPDDLRRTLLLAAAASHPTTDLLGESLGAAESDAIVTVGAGGRVRFTHPLYASAIYGDASLERRRAAHAELAARETDVEERARHLGLAATQADGDVARELESAAARARIRGAPEIAAELAERAFELTPADDPPAAGRRALTAAAHYFAGGATAQANRLLTGLLEHADDPSLRAGSSRLLAFVRFREERYGEAMQLFYAAADAAADDPAQRASVELDLTLIGFATTFDHTEAAAHAEAAIAYAERTPDTGLQANALAIKTMADFLLGAGIDERRLERALALEDPEAEVPIELRPTLTAGCLAFYTGRFEDAREILYPLRASLRDRGEDANLPFLSLNLAWLEMWAGNYAPARRLADEGIETAALGETMTAHALAYSALLDAHTGDVENCRERVAAAAVSMGLAEYCLVIQWSAQALGLLELSLGDPAAAHEALEPLTAHFEGKPVVEPVHLIFYPDEVEALVAVGDVERAAGLTEQLAASGRALDRQWTIALSYRCRALVLAARNDLAPAAAEAEQAVAAFELLPMPFDLARSLLVHGRIERRRKHKAAAQSSLDRALAICERIGARLWAERVHAELDRLGARRDPGELTATEERIAALAASGLTNREIAAAAFVTQKTVEANLSRIYRKLGIRSRAELGVRLAERRTPVS